MNRPSPQELFDRYKTMFQNIVLGGAQIVPESNEWYAASLNYAVAEDFYAISDQAAKERDPRYACAENLYAMADRDGVYPLPALPAQGYIRITGTPGTALPSPLQFQVDGKDYITANAATQPTALDASGSATIRVRAVIPGEEGNVCDTCNATLTTVVAGVNSSATVLGGSFCGGADEEDTEQFRHRYLRRLRYHPRATQQWILDKFLEWPCLTRAMVRAGTCCECGCTDKRTGANNGPDCGCKDCGGKMHFYVFFDDTFTDGIAPREVLDEVEDWMFGYPQGFGTGQVEIGICGRIYSVTCIPLNVNIAIDGCPTKTQLARIEEIVREFFTTLEPSKQMTTAPLAESIRRYLGTDLDIDIDYNLALPSQESLVYQTPCFIEPECDHMLTLNSVTFDSQVNSTEDCL